MEQEGPLVVRGKFIHIKFRFYMQLLGNNYVSDLTSGRAISNAYGEGRGRFKENRANYSSNSTLFDMLN